jgi:predicted RNase H-like HicB family nuclease
MANIKEAIVLCLEETGEEVLVPEFVGVQRVTLG